MMPLEPTRSFACVPTRLVVAETLPLWSALALPVLPSTSVAAPLPLLQFGLMTT